MSLQYNTWANRLIATQIEKMPADTFDKNVGGSFGSLKGVMTHLLESDWLWLQRFNGIPLADLPAWNITDVTSLNRIWQPVQDESVAAAKAFLREDNKMVSFTTRRGENFRLPFKEIVIHISHHGSYHRGQLTHMIRELGGEPVGTDYFLFYVRQLKQQG